MRGQRCAIIACAALALSWLVTIRLGLMCFLCGRIEIGVRGGAIILAGYSPPLSAEATTPQARIERNDDNVVWIPFVRVFPANQVRTPPISWVVAVPLWPAAAISAGAAVIARRRFRAASWSANSRGMRGKGRGDERAGDAER